MPTYIITGANRGLGLEFVRQLSNSGSNTIIAAVRSLSGDLGDLNALVSDRSGSSGSSGTRIHVLECNTASLSSIIAFGDKLHTILNGATVDYLLNNAGINSQPTAKALDVVGDDLRSHIDVNVLGPLETTKVVAPFFVRGSVVMNMSSGLGSFGKHIMGQTSYAISKAALNMYTVHAAEELKAKGVWVICMDPGWVKTRMGGDEALLAPEESITGMLRVVHGVGEQGTGKFYQWDGAELPW